MTWIMRKGRLLYLDVQRIILKKQDVRAVDQTIALTSFVPYGSGLISNRFR